MEEIKTIQSPELVDELEQIKREIASDLAKEEYRKNNLANEIMAEVTRKLGKGDPVTITKEMRELGLAGRVAELAHAYSINERIMRKLDLDDNDDDGFSPW